jgi:hypothetical protein
LFDSSEKTNQNCVREAWGAQKRGGGGGRGGGEGGRGCHALGGEGKAHTQRDASVSEGFRGFRVDVVGLVRVGSIQSRHMRQHQFRV